MINQETNSTNARATIPEQNISNPSNEEFLFFYKPQQLDVECLCGCSLINGVRIIAAIFALAGLSSLITAFKEGEFFEIITSFCLLVAYSLAGHCLYSSTNTYNYNSAYLAYCIYAIIFIIDACDIVITSLLMLLGIYHPLGHSYAPIKAIIFIIAGIIFLLMFLYLLWVVFCYTVHLQNKRIQILKGEFSVNENNQNGRERNLTI